MNAHMVSQIEDLLRTGMELVPEGGSEFSGYNAKRQSKYLLWRKNCLDVLGAFGNKGAAFSARIAGDENGMYFYHSSAQLIVTIMHEALDAARVDAEEAEARMRAETKAREEEARERTRQAAEARELAEETARNDEEKASALRREADALNDAEREKEAREEARKQIEALEAARERESIENAREEEAIARARAEAEAAAEAQTTRSDSAATKIVIFSLANHVMLKQLQNFFNEISLDHTLITHTEGIWDSLDAFTDGAPRYGVFLLSDRYHGQELMALGYIAGRYPSSALCCIHAHTLPLGELLPGVSKKEFAVSLDEIKFSLIKELKAAGCSVSL